MNIFPLFIVTVVICFDLSSLSSKSVLNQSNSEFAQSLKKDIKQQFKSDNNQCQLNISQSGSGDYSTIAEALENKCNSTYYIQLVDNFHEEHLFVNNPLPIYIWANHDFPTVWSINTDQQQIINLEYGNMTISKVEFKFQHFNASNNFKINPSFALIDLGNKQQQSLLFLFDCIFDSAPGITENNIIQVHIQNAAIAYFDNCTFNGIGKNQYTNITMIDVLLCQNISFQLCKFQNTAISRQLEAVHIYSFIENASISIIDCQFTNITSSYPKQSAALGIYACDNLSVQITWTNFTNCSALNSEAGAILISFFFEDNMISDFQITNNIFKNNFGINAGAIYCNILYLNERFNFSSNTFISNKNNQTLQVGKDAQLTFYEPPVDWSQSSTTEMIVDWFNGSTSDAKKDSVYFEAYRNQEKFMSGSVTLQHPPNWGKLSTTLLIGIIVGSVVIAASIATIIIIAIVGYKKV